MNMIGRLEASVLPVITGIWMRSSFPCRSSFVQWLLLRSNDASRWRRLPASVQHAAVLCNRCELRPPVLCRITLRYTPASNWNISGDGFCCRCYYSTAEAKAELREEKFHGCLIKSLPSWSLCIELVLCVYMSDCIYNNKG